MTPNPGWFKSSKSGPWSDNCVEVRFSEDRESVSVRDSKNRDGGIQVYTRGEWKAFLGGVREGEFDL